MIDQAVFTGRKALFHTFGCKLNFAETSTVARLFAEKGIRRIQSGETPDIVVINTCSVTEVADKKCRQAIRGFARRYPDAAIVVTGCYAQLKSEEIAALPGVAVVAGSDRKLLLSEYIDRWMSDHAIVHEVTPTKDIRTFSPSCSAEDRTRHFLKVQDGCDYWCTYCTIPMARGRSRSGTIDELVAQAEKVAEDGGREIVLTGVNIGDFGKGRDDNFFDLIRALDRVDGIERYRISSIEPNLLTDEIIDWVAGSRAFMPHFHVPLQAGSDEVLRLMRRHYDTSLFRHRMERIRSVMPHAFIGVDLIVGARGETDELFAKSRDFVESLDISRLHVFPYSERPGTRALELEGIVPQQEKHRRTNEMLAISERKLAEFSSRFAGTVRPVLAEHPRKGKPMMGFTDNYLRVRMQPVPELAGQVVNVLLGSPDNSGEEIDGEIIKP
ncbi:tRNA (N(6)-L-threonylcarbamoyladenosine(37)-C(2))-methylthiotransferase MtaB [Muribaculum sp.]|uniref:tRNA (N(6)-L-threonylcarbamoyladenosine(37)-C(2))- methylthiotransferase MtaB n=1 Tax=Muribaculum sp. TaxID=1918611 RepID=UPI0023C6DB11|nr:tRNA (N(6)-L-threonylcarbamoyladenosine(37)-C(2))-methylthiotransferase MtaB [Muribaculum sp.]MDE5705611.1 tRNA (N(6)-L-threonylcarbamoyladenosine(37)-C(2))-methylthiotransferase MtaB [Muribaculum sp.]